MSFRIPRRDTEIRFVTKFAGNRPPLRSCRKVLCGRRCEVAERFSGLPRKKRALRGIRPSRHLAKNGLIAAKIT